MVNGSNFTITPRGVAVTVDRIIVTTDDTVHFFDHSLNHQPSEDFDHGLGGNIFDMDATADYIYLWNRDLVPQVVYFMYAFRHDGIQQNDLGFDPGLEGALRGISIDGARLYAFTGTIPTFYVFRLQNHLPTRIFCLSSLIATISIRSTVSARIHCEATESWI